MSIHLLLHGLSARRCPMSPHFLTRRVSRLLGLAMVSWAFTLVGVHRLSLHLPYLGVFPFTLLHLPLNLICVSSLRLMYLHPSLYPSLTHFITQLINPSVYYKTFIAKQPK